MPDNCPFNSSFIISYREFGVREIRPVEIQNITQLPTWLTFMIGNLLEYNLQLYQPIKEAIPSRDFAHTIYEVPNKPEALLQKKKQELQRQK